MTNYQKAEQLEKLRELLNEYENTAIMPAIERDLLLEQMRVVYDLIKNGQHSAEREKGPEADIIQESPEPVSDEKVPDDDEIPSKLVNEELSADTPAGQVETVQPEAVTATLFDEISEDVSFSGDDTLHEKISAASAPETVAARITKNPIADLKKSIGINEKFSFINELFDGNLQEYNDCISALNGCEDHASALSVLDDKFAARYEWDTGAETYLKFRELVDRRFSG